MASLTTCAGCYSTAPLSSLLRPLDLQNRNFSSSLRWQSQRQQLNDPTGFSSFRSKKGFKLRKPPSHLRVFCLREPKAMVVTGKSWDKMILKSEIPVLVEFHASWCGPCQMVHRVIDEIAREYSGRLKCFVLHADEDMAVAESYDIKAVPVVLLFKNGEKRESVIGTMPKEFYVAAVERVLSL